MIAGMGNMAQENELIVSVSGIRGIVGQGLTAEATLAFAAALGTQMQGGRIVLSRDGRPSGAMLRHAVLAGLGGARAPGVRRGGDDRPRRGRARPARVRSAC